MGRLLARIRRAVVGPSREEMGLPPAVTALPPLHRDPVPYKPGTENALWGDRPTLKGDL